MEPPPIEPSAIEPSAMMIEQLLAHEGWLRRIVVELVDEHTADDVLQETWAAALAHGPGRLIAPRAWLRRVAHNLAMGRRRSEARRRQRETSAARGEALPSTDTIVERLHAHRQVARALAELEEPYRTAVLLRYVEELSPREIARRLQLSGSTVRTRIERGLVKVRGRLQSADLAALAVSVLTPRGTQPRLPATAGDKALYLALGVCAMAARHKTLIMTSSLLLLGAGFWLAGPSDAGEPPAAPAPAAARSPAAATAEPTAGARERRAVAPSPPPAPAMRTTLRGQVIDPSGATLAGVPLLFQPTPAGAPMVDPDGALVAGDAPAREVGASDGDGSFALELDGAAGALHTGGDWVTVRAYTPAPERRARDRALLVAAPIATLHGRVAGENGAPLRGVTVLARVDGLLRLDRAIDHTSRLRLPATRTNAGGDFALAGAPRLDELQLVFSKPGYETVFRYPFAGDTDPLVTLKRAPRAGYVVSGSVVDAAGHLVPGALVLLHQSKTHTGELGQFRIATNRLPPHARLLASRPGDQVADGSALLEPLRGRQRGQLDRVVLRLGPPALAIAGKVARPGGEPLAGATLCLLDADRIHGVNTVEDLVAGRESRFRTAGRVTMKVDARSDEHGAFRVGGLSPRRYRLLVFDPTSLASALAEVPAGRSDLTVELDTGARRRIAGRVLDHGGSPLPGLTVRWGLYTYRTEGMSLFSPGAATTTDAEGRFRLDGVPAGACSLALRGRDIVDTERDLGDVRNGESITLRAWARCRVRIAIADQRATGVQVLDASGEVLDLAQTMGPISTAYPSYTLRRGRTPVLEVSEAAATLVVLHDDQELARHAISLPRDRLVELEF